MPDHNVLAGEIHQDNIKVGWWKTYPKFTSYGKPSGEYETEPRNIGELLCLVHSELSEAFEGWKWSIADDHLPKQLMWHVELGDTCIRIYDILGYYKHIIHFEHVSTFDTAAIDRFLLEIHLRVSQAMERFRKGDDIKGCEKLVRALFLIWRLANRESIELEAIIEEKREYNRNPLDHKVENREQEGGKKF